MVFHTALTRGLVAISLAVGISGVTGCRPVTPATGETAGPSTGTTARWLEQPRPAVIGPTEGERRYLRGGTARLLIKVDPVSTGSRRMVFASSDMPPGDSIGVHRHLREDEIIFILRGTARVQLGARQYTASAGGTVYIPEGTCIAVANAGSDTLTFVFVFSSPGFEQVLRVVSSRDGEPPKPISPTQRAAAFHLGHAEAGPADC